MNISNLGRLIGAGLLALGLHSFAPQTPTTSMPATGMAAPATAAANAERG